MKISDYISDLLLFHEKVVLPGFGAFEIIRKHAIFKDHKASPPNILIVFNAEETLDDNLLISKIAEAEDIKPEEAKQKILIFVDEIKFTLNKGEKFSMPGFGELFLDENNNYVFSKDINFRIEFETSGFETFELDPLEDFSSTQNTEEEKKTELVKESGELIEKHDFREEEATIHEKVEHRDLIDERKSNRGFLWVIGGSVVVILVSFLIIALSTDLFDNLNTGLFKTQEKQDKGSPQLIFGGDEEFEKEFEAAMDSLTKLENALRITDEINADELTIASVYSEFHIIAGSFSIYKNAEELQRELNLSGFPSVILDRGDGYFRVSAISYTDKEKAMQELEAFIKTTPYKSSWVLGLN